MYYANYAASQEKKLNQHWLQLKSNNDCSKRVQNNDFKSKSANYHR